jgi:AcrR family transcriptional regulator
MRVRTQARRESIIEAAVELFEEAGYQGTSMSELARRLGGSKATLYGYFPSKEDLFVAVVQTFATAHLAEATAIVEAAIGSGPALAPLLRKAGRCVLQVMLNDRRAILVYRMVMAEAGRSDLGPLFHRAGPQQLADALTRLFADAMQRGVIRTLDPTITAMQFMALLTAETGQRLYERNPSLMSPAEIEQRTVRAVDMFLSGAKPKEQGRD